MTDTFATFNSLTIYRMIEIGTVLTSYNTKRICISFIFICTVIFFKKGKSLAMIAACAGEVKSITAETKLDWAEWEVELGDKWQSLFGSLSRFLQQ